MPLASEMKNIPQPALAKSGMDFPGESITCTVKP